MQISGASASRNHSPLPFTNNRLTLRELASIQCKLDRWVYEQPRNRAKVTERAYEQEQIFRKVLTGETDICLRRDDDPPYVGHGITVRCPVRFAFAPVVLAARTPCAAPRASAKSQVLQNCSEVFARAYVGRHSSIEVSQFTSACRKLLRDIRQLDDTDRQTALEEMTRKLFKLSDHVQSPSADCVTLSQAIGVVLQELLLPGATCTDEPPAMDADMGAAAVSRMRHDFECDKENLPAPNAKPRMPDFALPGTPTVKSLLDDMATLCNTVNRGLDFDMPGFTKACSQLIADARKMEDTRKLDVYTGFAVMLRETHIGCGAGMRHQRTPLIGLAIAKIFRADLVPALLEDTSGDTAMRDTLGEIVRVHVGEHATALAASDARLARLAATLSAPGDPQELNGALRH